MWLGINTKTVLWWSCRFFNIVYLQIILIHRHLPFTPVQIRSVFVSPCTSPSHLCSHVQSCFLLYLRFTPCSHVQSLFPLHLPFTHAPVHSVFGSPAPPPLHTCARTFRLMPLRRGWRLSEHPSGPAEIPWELSLRCYASGSNQLPFKVPRPAQRRTSQAQSRRLVCSNAWPTSRWNSTCGLHVITFICKRCFDEMFYQILNYELFSV